MDSTIAMSVSERDSVLCMLYFKCFHLYRKGSNNYKTIIVQPTAEGICSLSAVVYKVLSAVLLASLTFYIEEIIRVHEC